MIEAILVIAVVALGFVVHTHKVVIDRYSDKVDDLEKRLNKLKKEVGSEAEKRSSDRTG